MLYSTGLKQLWCIVMPQNLLIVPPEGWRYGFPKPFDGNPNSSLSEIKRWLLDHGYPSNEINTRIENFPVLLMNEQTGYRKLITT